MQTGGLPLALEIELVLRLVLAIVLGGVLGWERQLGGHAAGLRTHLLVALGSAAFTIAGTYGVVGHGTNQDPGRVAAQIVTGIGFLGAGTIWRSGSTERTVIYGLTTAASIWVAAAIGMLVAYGLYVLATGCTILSFTVLRLLKKIENAPPRVPRPTLRLGAASRRPAAGAPPPQISAGVGPLLTTEPAPATHPVPAGDRELEGVSISEDALVADEEPPAGKKKGKRGRKKGKRKRDREGAAATAAMTNSPPPAPSQV